MERICKKCGNPIDEGELFCDICGEKFDEADADKTVLVKNGDEKASAKPQKAEPKKSAGASAGFFKKHKEQTIFVAVAAAVIIIALVIVSMISANTPEAKLKKALEYRLSGNVNGSVSVDYESNFSNSESKSDALARMKGNSELTVKHDGLNIKILSETRLKDDPSTQTTDLTNRVNELSAGFKDTDKISDIRSLSYQVMEGAETKASGTAQAIKVDGKWYIFGVAQSALAL